MKDSNEKLIRVFGAMKGSDFSRKYSLYKSSFSSDKKTRRIAKLLLAMDSIIEENTMEEDGGKGSGNWGHAGRPGKVGGSQKEEGMVIAGGKHFREGNEITGYSSKFTKEERRLVGAVMQLGSEDRFIELLKDTGIKGVDKDEAKLRKLYRGLEQALKEHGMVTGKDYIRGGAPKPDIRKDPPKDIDSQIDDLEKQREELAKKIEEKKAEREKRKKEAEEKAKREAEEKRKKEEEEKKKIEEQRKKDKEKYGKPDFDWESEEPSYRFRAIKYHSKKLEGDIKSGSKLPVSGTADYALAETLWEAEKHETGEKRKIPASMVYYTEKHEKAVKKQKKEYGITDEQERQANMKVERLFHNDNNSFAIRFNPEDADKIFDSHFMNQIELDEMGIKGKTGGAWAPYERKRTSASMFGTDMTSRGKEFEAYGYLAPSDIRNDMEGAEQYGSAVVYLKKDKMAGRTTFTFCDSLGMHCAPGLIGVGGECSDMSFSHQNGEQVKELANISDESADGCRSFRNALGLWEYTELQYHGGVSFQEEVESIVFPGRMQMACCNRVPEMRKLGIKVYYREGSDIYEYE